LVTKGVLVLSVPIYYFWLKLFTFVRHFSTYAMNALTELRYFSSLGFGSLSLNTFGRHLKSHLLPTVMAVTRRRCSVLRFCMAPLINVTTYLIMYLLNIIIT